LEIGDIITYETTYGTKQYKVEINTVIKETDWSYLEDTKENKITLITCEENMKEYRRCIQATEF
jgi:LPXTG-site transpeptidase (sortase) family protein